MPTINEVWVIEGGDPSGEEFRRALQRRYRVRYFSDLTDLDSALRQASPSLLLADLRFDDQTLLGFLSHLDAGRIPPFIVMSDVDDGDVLRACFERGAVDFLSRPFTKGEFLARVERAIAPHLSGVKVSPSSMRVELGGNRSPVLTAKEFQILNLLVSASAHRLSRQSIVMEVWSEVRVVPKTFDVHLSKLRRKLEPIGIRISYSPPGDYCLVLETGDRIAPLPGLVELRIPQARAQL